jgi:hypothetical protein
MVFRNQAGSFSSPRLGLGTLALGALIALGLSTASRAAVSPAGLLATSALGQSGTGTIKGRLVWGGSEIPATKVLEAQGQAAKDPEICAKDAPIKSKELVVDPKTKGVSYGFIYLVRPKGNSADAAKALVKETPEVVLDQKNCEFLPYSTAMHQDQKLVVKSSDPVNHNVRFAAFNNNFNQVLAPNGQMELKLVPERRPIVLACDIHPWMKGYLMVFDHPFFAVTGKDGSFEIKGVPAGSQNLVGWQETVGYVTSGGARGMAVDVKPGGVTDVGEIVLKPK